MKNRFFHSKFISSREIINNEDGDYTPTIDFLASIFNSFIQKKAKMGESLNDDELEIIQGVMEACIDEELFEEALKFCDFLLSYNPYSSELLARKGYILLSLNELEKATETLRIAFELNPSDIDVLINLSLSYFNSGDIDSSLKVIDKALEVEPDENVLFHKGILLEAIQNYDQALSIFHSLTNSQELGLDAYQEIASIYFQQGKTVECIETNKKALELEPTSEWLWFNLGIYYFDLGRYYKAIDAFKNAIAIDPKYELAYYYLALSYEKVGKITEAIDNLKAYEQIFPFDQKVYLILGFFYADLSDYRTALEYFERINNINPLDSDSLSISNHIESTIAYLGAGLCLWNMNKHQKAEQYFLIALNLEPKNPDFWLIVIDTFVKTRKVSKTLSFFEKALTNNPNDPILLEEFTNFILDYKKYQKGIEILENCKTLTKENALINYQLGKLYSKSKKFSQAANSFAESIAFMPILYENFTNEMQLILPQKSFQKLKNELDNLLIYQKLSIQN